MSGPGSGRVPTPNHGMPGGWSDPPIKMTVVEWVWNWRHEHPKVKIELPRYAPDGMWHAHDPDGMEISGCHLPNTDEGFAEFRTILERLYEDQIDIHGGDVV